MIVVVIVFDIIVNSRHDVNVSCVDFGRIGDLVFGFTVSFWRIVRPGIQVVLRESAISCIALAPSERPRLGSAIFLRYRDRNASAIHLHDAPRSSTNAVLDMRNGNLPLLVSCDLPGNNAVFLASNWVGNLIANLCSFLVERRIINLVLVVAVFLRRIVPVLVPIELDTVIRLGNGGLSVTAQLGVVDRCRVLDGVDIVICHIR